MHEKYYQIHRSDAIQILLTKEKIPSLNTNLKLAELLEKYFPEKDREYIVIEDDLPLGGKFLTAATF
jgi:hypothetical protein